jgi:hypothetical protein
MRGFEPPPIRSYEPLSFEHIPIDDSIRRRDRKMRKPHVVWKWRKRTNELAKEQGLNMLAVMRSFNAAIVNGSRADVACANALFECQRADK